MYNRQPRHKKHTNLTSLGLLKGYFMLEVEVEKMLLANSITFSKTASNTYKILNGYTKNIMLYGSKLTLLVQLDGINKVMKKESPTAVIKTIKHGFHI